MNRILLVAFALLCAATRAFSESADDENLALVNHIQARVATGDTKALDELAAVPGKYSCPALLAIFKKKRTDAAVTSKCARLVVTVPGGEEFIQKLLNREAVDNPEFSQQEIAIKCLLLNHDKTSVRILAGTLDYFNPKEMGPIILRALATLNPPVSPEMSKDHATDAQTLTQWKEWWSAHEDNYAAEAASK